MFRFWRNLPLVRLAACIGLALPFPGGLPGGAGPVAAADIAGTPQRLRQAPLRITLAGGRTAVFTVQVATTEQQRNTGLMHRRDMPADEGMLFLFPRSRPVSFWMQNTFIPLDLLFIDDRGRISGIVANARPHSLDIIDSPGPAAAVLEINGGLAARLGIAVGDRVAYPATLRDEVH
ncbi:DUF192 domain-containing protein [Parapedomonas caeni]